MGRDNTNRLRAKFPFGKYKIEMYRPTEGQGAALMTAGAKMTKSPDADQLVRFFRVIESLVVHEDNWTAMDDAMVIGEADIMDFTKLAEEVFRYDWAALEKQLPAGMASYSETPEKKLTEES